MTALPHRPAELSFSKLVPHILMKSSWRRSTTPRTRARQLWLLLRRNLHSFLEKVRLAQGVRGEACLLAWGLPGVPSRVPANPLGSPRRGTFPPHSPKWTDGLPTRPARRKREPSCAWLA